MNDRHQWLRDLKPGDAVESVYALRSPSIRSTKRGKPYLTATLYDRSGEIQLRRWEYTDELPKELASADALKVGGVVESRNGVQSLIVESFEIVDAETLDAEIVVLDQPLNVPALLEELQQRLDDLEDPDLIRLRDALLDDPEFVERFANAPGARVHHHRFRHGLLLHTVCMLRLAHQMLGYYQELDRDLILMGVLLHDAGKIEELDPEEIGRLTVAGALLGHGVQGIGLLERTIAGLENFSPARRLQLLHILASNHDGSYGGRIKSPMFAEAQLLQTMESLEARMAIFREAAKRPSEIQDSSGGVTYHSMLRRYVYQPPAREVEDVEPEEG